MSRTKPLFVFPTAAVLYLAAVANPAESQQKPRSPEATGYHGISWSTSMSASLNENGELVRRTQDFPRVMSVRPCSPSHRAGIEPGDKLIEVDGRDLSQPGPPFEKIRPGLTYRFVIERDGERSEVEITLTERPTDPPAAVVTAPMGSLQDWNCPPL